MFKSVYVDLDTECLKPYDTLPHAWNVSTTSYADLAANSSTSINSITSGSKRQLNNSSEEAAQRTALLARMGLDPLSEHGIPNAWMASPPGHPFWLLVLEHIQNIITGESGKDGGGSGADDDPEYVTGPVSLWDVVQDYEEKYHPQGIASRGPSLDDKVKASGWRSLHDFSASSDGTSSTSEGKVAEERLLMLPFWTVYPFSWQRDGKGFEEICSVEKEGFDAERCKRELDVERWGSWSLTYWGHSWGYENAGLQERDDLKTEYGEVRGRI